MPLEKVMQAAPFSIGALSARTGCHIETIRYYERIGLLPAPPPYERQRPQAGAGGWMGA